MASITGNYHTHSLYSDGKASLEDYYEEAVRQELQYLGFSEHSPLPFPNSFALEEGKMDEYLVGVRRLGNGENLKTSGHPHRKVTVFAGLEMDYIPGISEGFSTIRNHYDPDYLIGSVHLVLNSEVDGLWFIDGPSRQIYDDGLNYYFNGDIRKAVTAYYRQLQKMIQNEPIDIVGHLDKIKMHNADRYFREDEPWYHQLVMETLEEIALQGLVVEINTRGIYKKRSPSLFPGIEILKSMREMKIPILLSSDAHAPEELTLLFNDTQEQLKTLGFNSVRQITAKGWVDVLI
jgi:histidinol-phosphatase (PHP family)